MYYINGRWLKAGSPIKIISGALGSLRQQKLARDPYTFVDYGRQMRNGEPALLKSRQHIKEAAVELWRSLVRSGWKKTEPLG